MGERRLVLVALSILLLTLSSTLVVIEMMFLKMVKVIKGDGHSIEHLIGRDKCVWTNHDRCPANILPQCFVRLHIICPQYGAQIRDGIVEVSVIEPGLFTRPPHRCGLPPLTSVARSKQLLHCGVLEVSHLSVSHQLLDNDDVRLQTCLLHHERSQL